jgi:RNA polymerase sigma factor (sigma-70 family)
MARDEQSVRFLSLLRPIEADLENYCRRMVFDRRDFEDALQNAVLRAFRAFDRYHDDASFRAWMFKILTNEIFAMNRKRGRIAEFEIAVEPEEMEEFAGLDFAGEEPISWETLADALDEELVVALQSLNDSERAVLLMRAIGELRYREISECLGIPLGSVMGNLSRARQKMRDAILRALRVKVQQQRDEIALRRAEENVRLASAKLVQILHLDPIVELMPRDASVVPLSIVSAKESLGDLVSRALAARPETQQSAALLSAAQHAKNGSIYGPLIPSVGGQAFFGGLGGGMNSETGHFGESEDYVALLTWRVGPGGLFDFGNIHARQARLRGAAFTADKVIDQVANEVITSQTRVQSLADQIATAKQSLSDAAEALRLGQERKEFGVGVVLETILAEQDLARARNDYLNIVTDYNKTQYALLRALGRLSTRDQSSGFSGIKRPVKASYQK